MALWHLTDLRDGAIRRRASRKAALSDGKWPRGLSLAVIILASLGLWAAISATLWLTL